MNNSLNIWQRSRSWLLQILFFLLIWLVVQWLGTLKLLDTGEQAPDFSLPTISGSTLQSDLLKGRPTLIYFFAPWCGVCHFSIDSVEQLKQDRPEINVVAIALDYKTEEEVNAFIAEHSLTIPILLGNRNTASTFRIKGFPTYYTIDSGGRVVAKDVGVSTDIGIAIRTWLAN